LGLGLVLGDNMRVRLDFENKVKQEKVVQDAILEFFAEELKKGNKLPDKLKKIVEEMKDK
jgi:hypothetical protein